MENFFEIPGITYDPAESFRVLRKSQAEQEAFYELIHDLREHTIYGATVRVLLGRM